MPPSIPTLTVRVSNGPAPLEGIFLRAAVDATLTVYRACAPPLNVYVVGCDVVHARLLAERLTAALPPHIRVAVDRDGDMFPVLTFRPRP